MPHTTYRSLARRSDRWDDGKVSEVGRVERMLQGHAAYDTLTDSEQTAVRAAWDIRDAAYIATLDFTRTCPDSGATYEASPECREGRDIPRPDLGFS